MDHEAVDYVVYTQFHDHAPIKTGEMRDGIQYTETGSSTYWWDDVIYAGYQDTETAYAGWWSQELPATWDRVVSQMYPEGEHETPDWLLNIVGQYL